MAAIVFYDDDGRILGSQGGLTEAHIAEYEARGLQFAIVPDYDVRSDRFMVQNGQVVPREDLFISVSKNQILADGEDVAVISGLPENCTVLIDTVPTVISDGTLEIVSDLPATYHIYFDDLPYAGWSTKIEAI